MLVTVTFYSGKLAKLTLRRDYDVRNLTVSSARLMADFICEMTSS